MGDWWLLGQVQGNWEVKYNLKISGRAVSPEPMMCNDNFNHDFCPGGQRAGSFALCGLHHGNNTCIIFWGCYSAKKNRPAPQNCLQKRDKTACGCVHPPGHPNINKLKLLAQNHNPGFSSAFWTLIPVSKKKCFIGIVWCLTFSASCNGGVRGRWCTIALRRLDWLQRSTSGSGCSTRTGFCIRPLGGAAPAGDQSTQNILSNLPWLKLAQPAISSVSDGQTPLSHEATHLF